jgi:hypothetical protein
MEHPFTSRRFPARTVPADCAVGVWEVMGRLPNSSTGGGEAGLRGVGETLDDVLVEAQMFFGSSNG